MANSPIRRASLCLLAVAAMSLLTGCEAFGFLAHAFTPTDAPLQVKAEYRGLEGQTVAVLVDADQTLLFEHPMAQSEVCEAVSLKLAANVQGVTVMNPRQVVDFQNRNIYWNTVPYSELAARLQVSRLVIIQLSEYRFHERGTVKISRGIASGHVGVVEADGDQPNDLVYDSPVTIAYPPDKPLGALNVNERTFRMATLDLFARAVAGRFHDHVESGK